ncbi:hyperosmotically inducible protein [Paraburkholderia sp. GAS41]|jgi:hyperosmotically inducible protein|uniref:BON domain-containing protein n=1 Tax=Paraburkholderia sp. GAS41 TaxID=3035134 RepID=UPI003D210819
MNSSRRLLAVGAVCCLAVAAAVTAHAQPGSEAASSQAGASQYDKKAASKADRKLAQDVRRTLGKAGGINVANVFVRARSGVVTLSGSVTDSNQIAKASEIAASVDGVTSVVNRLSIEARIY